MIFALDLGTSTGFAHGDGGSIPVVNTVRMPNSGDDVGAFLKFFRDWLVPYTRRLQPDLIAFEAPILPKPKWDPVRRKFVEMTNIMTTRKLQSLAGVLELIAADLDIPCFEVHLSTAKATLAGHGHAEKADMLAAARRQGVNLGTGSEAFDEADAFAIWLTAIQFRRPEAWPAWKERLRGEL